MLFVVKERLEGLNYNIDFWRRGGVHRVRGYMCTIQFYRSVSTLSSLIVAKGNVGRVSSPYFLLVF